MANKNSCLKQYYDRFIKEIGYETEEDKKWALAMAWNVLYGTVISDRALAYLLWNIGDEKTVDELVEETAAEILEAFGE